jgi:alpha-1,2-mannosyltransferase
LEQSVQPEREKKIFFHIGKTGAFLGVPFAAIVLIPMALQVFLNEKLVALFVWACIGGVVSLLPQLLIDRYFYGKWVCAVCNIIKYNALDNDSTLYEKRKTKICFYQNVRYGVEPVSFYIKNLLLNLNLFFPMAVLSIVFALLAVRRDLYLRNWIIISPVPWLVFMFAMPHKEQRFLYPVYPLLLAAGAAVFRIFPSRRVNLPFLCGLLCVAVVATSGARLAALNSRSGSMTIWRHVQPLNNKTICLGDEWYRFPSSFWLPNDSVRVEFVRAGFRGLLPKHFASSANATSAVPSHMNNKNSEERSRYVDLSRCDYIVEEETESSSDGPVLARTRILDESRTSSFSRAFRVPFVTRAQSKGYQIRILK